MRTVWLLLFTFSVGTTLFAQEDAKQAPQWFFELRGMKLWIGGVNEKAGNILSIKETYSLERSTGQRSERLDYSYKKTPISLSRSSFNFCGELRYRIGSSYWLGVGGFYFSTNSGGGGVVRTPGPYETQTKKIQYWSGIEFWDANIFALYNDQSPSEAADITWSVADVFQVWSVQTLLHVDDLPFFAGLQISQPHAELNFKVRQRAYLSADKGYGYGYHNDVSLRSVHASDFGILLGPVFGFELSKEWEKFSLNFYLSEAFLLGSADYRGAFYDVDDITIDWSSGLRQTMYLNGDVTYADPRSIFVPVTALDIKFGIKESEDYRLGMGLFGKFWHGLPLGPTLHRPWDIGNPVNAPSGIEWRIDSKTVKIYGFYFFLSAMI